MEGQVSCGEVLTRLGLKHTQNLPLKVAVNKKVHNDVRAHVPPTLNRVSTPEN